MMRKILLAMVLTLWGGSAWANSCPSYTYTLTNGTTADASQVMGNFNTVMNCASFFIGTTSTGSATAQVLSTVTPAVFTLTSGNRVTFIAGFTSTGATTLNVASTGVTNVYKKTASGLTALIAGDMIAGQVYTVQYDGTQYELLDPVGATQIVGIEYVLDGGGTALTTGVKGYLEVPFACTINRVTLLADQSGSVTIDLWKVAYASFPPTTANSITASAVPALSAAQKYQDSTLTGWTTAVNAGDILAFDVKVAATSITRVTGSLKCTKS